MTLTEQPTTMNSFAVQAEPAKNRVLLAAGAIATFTVLVHVFAGGADTARPLAASALADLPRLTMLSVWHITSVTMSLSAIALFLGALPKHREAAQYLTVFIGIMWVGFGLCFLGVGLIEEGGNPFTVLNQWTLLIPTGALALWGSIRD